LDRILEGCLAKNPAARVPRIQNVNLELKLLTVATRRSEAAAVVRRERAEAATRSDMRDLEVRIEARFTAQADVYEKAFSNLERAANDTVEIFREQLAGLRTELAAAQDRVAALEGSVKTAGETAGGIRGELDDFAKRSQQVEQSVVTELRELARHMKAHAAAIEAARASTTHNEELLERVIGELASLQADVLEPEHPAAEEAVLA
jgi:chromosome segregation ATPase